ncbi:MAG: hypothetical protein AAF198_00295 [Pseudomonadota bacterium]
MAKLLNFDQTIGEKRIVLAQPIAGFNDQLNQTALCLDYCRRTGRDLIVNFKGGGLKHHLSDIFEPPFSRSDLAPQIWCMGAFESIHFEGRTTHPDCLKGHARFLRTEIIGKHSPPLRVIAGTNSPSSLHYAENFQLRRIEDVPDFDAQIVLHLSAGGGIKGINFLKLLSLQAEIANAVLRRLVKLPKSLTAVHIRHTDIAADAPRFFQALNSTLEAENLLICSDNQAVKEMAKDALSRSINILSVSDLPDFDGAPTHLKAGFTASRDGVVSLLTDLLAMSGAQQLGFPTIMRGRRVVISGFSYLADQLRQTPDIQKSLLKFGDNTLKHQYFENGPPSLPRNNNLSQKLIEYYPELACMEAILG